MELARVIIFTRNVDRLADFYRMCFDLQQVGDSNVDWAELAAGGCRIAFHRIDNEAEHRDGWVKIVFGSKDVAGERSRLEGLGVRMSDVVEFDGIQLCDGRDPDGNFFQISSRGM